MNKRKFWLTLMKRFAPKLYASSRLVDIDDDDIKSRRANALRIITPDSNARLGVAYDGLDFRDLDSRAVYTMVKNTFFDPVNERLDRMERMLIAAGQGHGSQAQAMIEQAQVASVSLATGQTLTALMQKHNFRPKLHSILIGEYADGEQVKPLTLDLPNSVHVLNTGASGLGKSTLSEAIAIQCAGLDDVQVAAIDYGSGTFDRLEPLLHWQIADDPGLAIALLIELIKLCDKRKAAYKEIGRIRSLAQYNAVTGENLPFVVAFVDETPALLDNDADKAGVRKRFIELARMGRKYGLGLVLGGTDFKATTLPSEARSNCQARIAFWLERGLSMSLLGNNDAFDIEGNVGQVVVKKPGVKGTLTGQTPNVVEGDYANLDLTGSPIEIVSVAAERDEIDDRVLELKADGESDTAIARQVYGHGTTYYIEKVRGILQQQHNNA